MEPFKIPQASRAYGMMIPGLKNTVPEGIPSRWCFQRLSNSKRASPLRFRGILSLRTYSPPFRHINLASSVFTRFMKGKLRLGAPFVKIRTAGESSSQCILMKKSVQRCSLCPTSADKDPKPRARRKLNVFEAALLVCPIAEYDFV